MLNRLLGVEESTEKNPLRYGDSELRSSTSPLPRTLNTAPSNHIVHLDLCFAKQSDGSGFVSLNDSIDWVQSVRIDKVSIRLNGAAKPAGYTGFMALKFTKVSNYGFFIQNETGLPTTTGSTLVFPVDAAATRVDELIGNGRDSITQYRSVQNFSEFKFTICDAFTSLPVDWLNCVIRMTFDVSSFGRQL